MLRRLAFGLLVAVLLAGICWGSAGRAAAGNLPALKGADWQRIFLGSAGPTGAVGGFSAPGVNGYPRDCKARAGACGPMQCCGEPCNARADGRPSADQAWAARVQLRADCRSPWQAGAKVSGMFPTGWPDSLVRATVLSAYRAGRALPGGEGLWCGCAGAMTLFGRQTDGLVTEAWPSLDTPCGCEAVPLHLR